MSSPIPSVSTFLDSNTQAKRKWLSDLKVDSAEAKTLATVTRPTPEQEARLKELLSMNPNIPLTNSPGAGAGPVFRWPLDASQYGPADAAALGKHKQATEEVIAIAQMAQGVSVAALKSAFSMLNQMGDMPVFTWILLLSSVTNKTFVANQCANVIAGLTDVPTIFTMSDGTSNGEAGNFSALAMAGHALMNLYFHDRSGTVLPNLKGDFLEMYKAKTSESGLGGAASNNGLKQVRRELLIEQHRVLGNWFPPEAREILKHAASFEAGVRTGAGGRTKLSIRATRASRQ